MVTRLSRVLVDFLHQFVSIQFDAWYLQFPFRTTPDFFLVEPFLISALLDSSLLVVIMAGNGFCWFLGLPFSCDLWCSDSRMVATSAFGWLLD